MIENHWDIGGEPISPEYLAIPKAKATANFLLSGAHLYARFIEARRPLTPTSAEAIIFEVDAEVGQEPAQDIRKTERIAATFTAADEGHPEVTALRVDFPRVPHLLIGEEEFPRRLCLYEEPYDEIKLRWTAPGFIERVRDWLRETAAGTLHGEDQPLEPLFIGSFWPIVIPADIFAGSNASSQSDRLAVAAGPDGPHGPVLVAKRVKPQEAIQGKFLATSFRCEPVQHGIIHRIPKNLYEVHQLAQGLGLNLLQDLRNRLDTWTRAQAPLDSHLILIIFFPKTRSALAAPESEDIWAFMTIQTIGEIGGVLSLWELRAGSVGRIIGADLDPKSAAAVQIYMLNPTLSLSRERAAALSGVSADKVAITAVGVGALGSQVAMRLMRAGYGKWVLIDYDRVLPHNIPRHELTNDAVGFLKAETMKHWLQTALDEDDVATAIVADVLRPKNQADAVNSSFANAQVIADFSASLAVGRYIARDVDSSARRISLFLNPTGTDLVLLAENRKREPPLDTLEMQYYRELITDEKLAGHLVRPQGHIRYAHSCRDLTSTISGDSIAMFAAIGSRAIRDALAQDQASIRIWRSDPKMNVKAITINAPPPAEILCDTWKIGTDQWLLAKIAELRKSKLPNETGGILLGTFDLYRRIVYAVDTIPSPPDSTEWPMLYIRGCEGLLGQVQKIQETTDGMLHYVGEWHSHPDGISCQPSKDDRTVFAWLSGHMHRDGFPAVMLIAGEHENTWFVDSMLE